MSYKIKRFSILGRFLGFGSKGVRSKSLKESDRFNDSRAKNKQTEYQEYNKEILDLSKKDPLIKAIIDLRDSKELNTKADLILKENGGDWPEFVDGIFYPRYCYFNGDENKIVICTFGREDYGLIYNKQTKKIFYFFNWIVEPDPVDKNSLIRFFEGNQKKYPYDDLGEIDLNKKPINRKMTDKNDRAILEYTYHIVSNLKKT
jgi:hypothetical protein